MIVIVVDRIWRRVLEKVDRLEAGCTWLSLAFSQVLTKVGEDDSVLRGRKVEIVESGRLLKCSAGQVAISIVQD